MGGSFHSFFRLSFDGVCCSGGLIYDEFGFLEQYSIPFPELCLVMISHSRAI